MTWEDRKWVIITLSDYTTDQLQELIDNAHQDSIETLRKSLDGTLTILKWDGDTPSVFDGMTTYNHAQIRSILHGSAWSGGG